MNDGPVSVAGGDRPFPGLRAFRYEDSAYYFGRTQHIYSLYRMLDRSRFVAVVGSSGSGKSSLVFAGLRPLLEKDSKQQGGRRWVWRDMSPKNAPINNLIDLVYGLAAEYQTATERDPTFASLQRNRIEYLIRLSSQGLVDALAEIDGLEDKTLVLLVDQFEELFRHAKISELRHDAGDALRYEEAMLFVQLLLEASRNAKSRLQIMLTMRSDFIGDCAAFRGLPQAVSETQFLVPALTPEQLEQVICKPIEKCGATIDPRLVGRLLSDVIGESDQLPVLQHCLARLWQEAGKSNLGGAIAETAASAGTAPPRQITLAHYDAVGRISGALSQHADEIMAGIPGLDAVTERVFRALSEVDRSGRAIRRALPFEQLAEEVGGSHADLLKVLDRFRADDCSFVQPGPAKELEQRTLVDVGHEALLRRWKKVCGEPGATGAANDPRPVGWLREEEDDGRHYQALLYLNELSPSEVPDTLKWWEKRPRTPAWANRYGGRFEHVRKLILDGQTALKRQVWRRWFMTAAVAAGCLFLAAGGIVYFVNEQNTMTEISTAYTLTKGLLSSVQDSLNRGDISSAAGLSIADLLAKSINQPSGVRQNPELKAELLLILTDIYYEVGDFDQAYAEAASANALAEQSLRSEPGNVRLAGTAL